MSPPVRASVSTPATKSRSSKKNTAANPNRANKSGQLSWLHRPVFGSILCLLLTLVVLFLVRRVVKVEKTIQRMNMEHEAMRVASELSPSVPIPPPPPVGETEIRELVAPLIEESQAAAHRHWTSHQAAVMSDLYGRLDDIQRQQTLLHDALQRQLTLQEQQQQQQQQPSLTSSSSTPTSTSVSSSSSSSRSPPRHRKRPKRYHEFAPPLRFDPSPHFTQRLHRTHAQIQIHHEEQPSSSPVIHNSSSPGQVEHDSDHDHDEEKKETNPSADGPQSTCYHSDDGDENFHEDDDEQEEDDHNNDDDCDDLENCDKDDDDDDDDNDGDSQFHDDDDDGDDDDSSPIQIFAMAPGGPHVSFAAVLFNPELTDSLILPSSKTDTRSSSGIQIEELSREPLPASPRHLPVETNE